jgi:hypothetical protein
MCGATFFPVIPHFLADKGIRIFTSNVAARADFAPSRQHFFHFHLRLLSSCALACRIKKAQKGLFPADSGTIYGTARPKCCPCLVLDYRLQVVSFSVEKYMSWPVLSLVNNWFPYNFQT